LRIGLTADAEPKEGGIAYGGGGAGGSESMWMLHASLTNYDESGALQPRLAERVPTVENGDWVVLPDGTMEVTWKLRPDIRWHDGTPLSAEDLVLGYRVGVDPELFQRGTRVLRQMSEVTAPDAQTLVIRWRNIYIYANAIALDTLVPLPRHKFAALYDSGDRQALYNTTAWYEEWVGLGPYKMREWQRASYIEADAYDSYFLGRPKIDRISIRFFGDTNTLVVSTMGGHVDVIPVGSLKEGEAHVLKSQWEAAGGGNVVVSHNKLRRIEWYWRDPGAPWMQDVRIRQALTNLIDRPAIADTIRNGLSAVDDISLSRQDPAYRLAQQRGVPNLAFDVTLAHRLLAEAGLTRDASGVYRTRAGTPFTLEISTSDDIDTNVQELLAISNQWKTAGIEPVNVIIPGTANKDEMQAKTLGAPITSGDLSYRAFEAFLTSEVRSDANRWRGANLTGYTNPAYDQLHTRLFSTVNSAERDQVAAELVKLSLDQMIYSPLVYTSDVSAGAKGIRGMVGVLPLQRITGWNAHLWEMP
jgi:peptide/nickel transport system substrate-binding protein